MTDNDDREPATDVITALGNLISRFPVTDTVKATRAAAEATATVIRQGQAVLEVHLDNARLREALATAAAREKALLQRAQVAEAQADRLRQVVRLLTEPDLSQPTALPHSPTGAP
jgi:hypothetical protein